jgi:tetratricopeptide (TPR) repeat protein
MLIIAGLMKEEADLCAILERLDEACRLNLKALNLTLIAAGENDTAEWLNVHGQIEELLTRLSGYELPAETKQLLWTYYDSAGRFADAEDVLFELLDHYGSDGTEQAAYERLLEKAVQFYERLLTLDEDRLEAGRLPLDEVRDSLEEVKARASELDRDAP